MWINSSEIVRLHQKRREKEARAALIHKTRNYDKHPFIRKVNITTLEIAVEWSFTKRISMAVHQTLRKHDQKRDGKNKMEEACHERVFRTRHDH